VVEIGRIHSTLDSMSRSLLALERLLSPVEPEGLEASILYRLGGAHGKAGLLNRSFSEGEGAPLPPTWATREAIPGDRCLGTECHHTDASDGEHDTDELDVLEELAAIITQVIHGLRLPLEQQQGPYDDDENHEVPVGSQAETFPPVGSENSLFRGDELGVEWGAGGAGEGQDGGVLLHELLLQRKGWATLSAALRELERLGVTAQRWVNSCRATLAAVHSPPLGRHWFRALMGIAITAPVVKVLLTSSVRDVHHYASTAWWASCYVWRWYVYGPAVEVYKGLFSPRTGTELRRQALRQELESMSNVVRDYHEDYYAEVSPHELQQVKQKALEAGDYGLVSRHYEAAIRHPIRSIFFGSLVRLLLIQMQQQKLELTKVLTASDEVLEANDLNFRMMALGPLAIFSVLFAWFFVFRRKRRQKPVIVRMRALWRQLHRIVSFAEDDRSRAGAAGSSVSQLSLEDQGRVLLVVHEMRSFIDVLCGGEGFLPADLRQDLDDIENVDSSRHQRLLTLDRMMAVHGFLSARE
jgi:hypothetical protein